MENSSIHTSIMMDFDKYSEIVDRSMLGRNESQLENIKDNIIDWYNTHQRTTKINPKDKWSVQYKQYLKEYRADNNM